jgi:LPS export ABC transporter permease LptG
VIFVYYILLYMARAAALGGKLNPDVAPWIPHLVIGAAGVGLLLWRARSADQPIRIGVPAFWRWLPRGGGRTSSTSGTSLPQRAGRFVLVFRVPHLQLPRPHLLDLYLSRQYLRVFLIALFSLLGVFYIATFIDLADKLFRGQATTPLLLRYFYYQTPQFVYYVIPMAGLVAALVTVGVMTKNSELIVMRACGISLYRTAAPLVLFGLAGSVALFALEERVLARANREADRLNSIIRGFPVQTFDALNRRWLVGQSGDIYYYDSFVPSASRFDRFTLYDFDDRLWKINGVVFAERVSLEGRDTGTDHPAFAWKATNGWVRTLTTTRGDVSAAAVTVTYAPFAARDLPLESPTYFRTEAPDALKMNYGQLAEYIKQLEASGSNAIPQMVQLQAKVAFPLVTLIMTLIAVPFAATTGRRGALYGVGVGIVLAIVYRVTQIVFGALGEGGAITPILAAWAPNILFGAAAVYAILTVKT